MRAHVLAAAGIALFAFSANAEAIYSIKGSGRYGCMHKADLEKTIEYMAQNDREAFKQFLGLGIETGVCTFFKEREPVFIVKLGLLTSKVRRKGNTAEYWIDSSALEK
jgi:hypothetical protein